jgi:IS30 family transposase
LRRHFTGTRPDTTEIDQSSVEIVPVLEMRHGGNRKPLILGCQRPGDLAARLPAQPRVPGGAGAPPPPAHSSVHGHSQGRIIDAISIRERPAEVEDRAIPGHWEGDLLRGARNSHVATLVERHSRFCMLVKVPGKDTATVVAALSRQVLQLPATLRRSLSWDRGLEMAQHKSFTVATDMKVYFCDPQSPWQRGSNENTNGLLRQYLPKKADLSCYSQSDLDQIALRLNQRPRKTLGFHTPADRLQASVASTP